MPGQYNTRRNVLGQVEKIPEAEQGYLKAQAEGITPPPPAAKPSTMTQADLDFLGETGGAAVLADAPKRQPAIATKPAAPKPTAPPIAGQVADAATDVGMGAAAGGLAGAGGAAAMFLANKAVEGLSRSQESLIGTPEGLVGRQQDNSAGILKEMFELQQQVARVGQPILGETNTTAIDSRI